MGEVPGNAESGCEQQFWFGASSSAVGTALIYPQFRSGPHFGGIAVFMSGDKAMCRGKDDGLVS